MMENLEPDLIVRCLPLTDYAITWQHMQRFTQLRTATTPDELWLVEHPPVYTLGQSGKFEHIFNPGAIPIIQADRGGQVTYHGPGQIVAYVLIDLKRKELGVRQLVTLLENSLIALLAEYHITAAAKAEAPGVYVEQGKIGSIGLRIRRGCSYHGLSFNVQMDLAPFSGINPCGYKNMAVTQLSELISAAMLDKEQILAQLVYQLTQRLRYQHLLLNFEQNNDG